MQTRIRCLVAGFVALASVACDDSERVWSLKLVDADTRSPIANADVRIVDWTDLQVGGTSWRSTTFHSHVDEAIEAQPVVETSNAEGIVRLTLPWSQRLAVCARRDSRFGLLWVTEAGPRPEVLEMRPDERITFRVVDAAGVVRDGIAIALDHGPEFAEPNEEAVAHIEMDPATGVATFEHAQLLRTGAGPARARAIVVGAPSHGVVIPELANGVIDVETPPCTMLVVRAELEDGSAWNGNGSVTLRAPWLTQHLGAGMHDGVATLPPFALDRATRAYVSIDDEKRSWGEVDVPPATTPWVTREIGVRVAKRAYVMGTDPWVRADYVRDVPRFERLPQAKFGVVTEAHQAEAQALLAEHSSCVVSIEQARLFGSDANADTARGEVFVLLRGVKATPDESATEGSFTIRSREGAVIVTYTCSRARGVPEQRRALVAVLQREPSEVFVRCWVAFTGGVKSE